MTLTEQLAGTQVNIVWILTIEGVGWHSNEGILTDAGGFAGGIFTTHDPLGTLDANLGSSGHATFFGLQLPQSISDTLDMRTGRFQPGAVSFRICDVGGVFENNFNPHLTTGTVYTLKTTLGYNDTTIDIVGGAVLNEGDEIWLGDREKVILGTKATAGPDAVFTGSTRAAHGTPRGTINPLPYEPDSFAWIGGTTTSRATRIRTFQRVYTNRRVALYMYDPTEAITTADALRLVYRGRLSNISADEGQQTWSINTYVDYTGPIRRWRERPPQSKCTNTGFVSTQEAIDIGIAPASMPVGGTRTGGGGGTANRYATALHDGQADTAARKVELQWGGPESYWENAFAYNYRNYVRGGTQGVYGASSTTPQALTDTIAGTTVYKMDRLCNIGGNYLRCLWKARPDVVGRADGQAIFGDEPNLWEFMVEAWNTELGSTSLVLFEPDLPITFLIDNYASGRRNPFRQNRHDTRNPIDILLQFLTSMNNEFHVGDIAAASTRFILNFAGTPGWTTDQWAGYALHCVEGTHVGQSRVITSNTASSITVSPGFTNVSGAPVAGSEYQIRNTIYDRLPFSWGMQLHNSFIDVESFEKIRGKYLGDARLGYFALGDSEKYDLWHLLYENICRPYQLLLYVDRITGKLTARWMGALGIVDGLDPDENYLTLGADDILTVGRIDYMPRESVREISISHRESHLSPPIKPVFGPANVFGVPTVVEYQKIELANPDVNADSKSTKVIVGDLDMVLEGITFESINMDAMFHTDAEIDQLYDLLKNKLLSEIIPFPEVDVDVQWTKFFEGVNPGALVSLTDTTRWNPYNTFTGQRGWSAQVARVISTTVNVSANPPSLRLKLQLLPSVQAARVAPAARVTGKGSDVNGDYFTVHGIANNSSRYASDTTTKDWELFAVNDRIELRDEGGALKEGPEVITGFGTNFVADPDDATSGRVYVSGTIASVIATDDYITFSPWTPSNTANMENYVALADASDTLGSGNDPAKEYYG